MTRMPKPTEAQQATVARRISAEAVYNNPAVAYIRVSRPRQGRSGLGLEAQQAAIAQFAKAHGYRIAETFSEVETGKGADAVERRPKLAAAIKAARRYKAPVIIAKLGCRATWPSSAA